MTWKRSKKSNTVGVGHVENAETKVRQPASGWSRPGVWGDSQIGGRQKCLHLLNQWAEWKLSTWGGTSSAPKCPPLNWKVGCSIYGHWVNCRSTPWARVSTQSRWKGQVSGFGLPLTAVTKIRIKVQILCNCNCDWDFLICAIVIC